MDPELERFQAAFSRRHAPPRGPFTLLPLGSPGPLEDLRRFAADAFRCEARILDPVRPPRPGPIESTGLLDWIADRRPGDAMACLAVTEADLFAPGRPWVFGESSLRSGGGVFSLARLGGIRVRALRLLAHEGAHLLALPHCRRGPCVLEACPTLEDLDRLPLAFCEADRRKLDWVAGALGRV